MRSLAKIGCALCLLVGVSAAIAAPESQGSPRRGQALYEQHCLRCHGETGNGNGPDARTLIVPPANFHLGKYRAKTNQDLLIAIQDGVLFSPMHGWRGKLTDQDIADVIEYLRFIAPFLAVS